MRYNRVTKEEGKMAKKAPGKHYRRGLTLSQLFKKFPDEGAAQVWFSEEFWPDGPYCPHCGSINVQASIKHPTMTHRCRDCPNRRMFSLKTGTVMQGSPLSYRTWAIAIYLVTTNLKGVSSMKLHRDLGISQKSAWFLAHRLRETWKTHYFFKGPVEVDETFVGGNRKNMSRKKRKELSGTGRGPKGKTIVAGVKDRDTNKVSARVVKATDAHTLQLFINERVCKTATVYTDEHGGYASIKNDHEAVKHSTGEYVKGEVSTQGIESFWAMLKRAHKGTYHKLSPKHLDRHVQEFSGRHNAREMDTINQMQAMATGMRHKRLQYTQLTAYNGLSSGARS